jgi:endonuclease G
MKQESIRPVVEAFQKRYNVQQIESLKQIISITKPSQLVSKDRLRKRSRQLSNAEGRASVTAKERILGINDLVDMNYLIRALNASRSVCRIILRDESFREIGYATGFKVTPNLLLTNHHVFDKEEIVRNALIEFDFELDILGNPKPSTRFPLLINDFFLSYKKLDYALVAIDPNPVFGQRKLTDYGFLRLNPTIGKINVGEFATIIQHPSGQPKQVALRENELLSIDENTLLYQSDTAQGSSGSPVFNDSWQVVGLHHSGMPRTDDHGNWLLKNGDIATRFDDDADIDWVANAGIRASRIVKHVMDTAPSGTWKNEFEQACKGILQPDNQAVAIPGNNLSMKPPGQSSQPGILHFAKKSVIDIPIRLTISMNGVQVNVGEPSSNLTSSPQSQNVAPSVDSANALERKRQPDHDPNYDNRLGYNEYFLGKRVPMPRVYNSASLSKLDNGDYYFPYQHFSIVNHKRRRLAMFAASNIDASKEAKKPEPGKRYGRTALGGLGKNDREEWFIDPRIPEDEQLSDNFYNKDRKAFDKGHIVRRDDVAWGETYEEVKRANGDSYHITNCSPQVKDFNRSNLRGIWGRLENEVLRQAKTEKYCMFSGPVLRKDDPIFKGVNHKEGVEVKIPRAYWKIIVAKNEFGDLESFGFLLAQDLSRVAFEFDVKEEWVPYMVSIDHLQKVTTNIAFPPVVKRADQYDTVKGQDIRDANELKDIDLGRITEMPQQGILFQGKMRIKE